MPNIETISIRETAVEAIRPLRHAVLRAGLAPEAAVFDGDDEPTARHIAALVQSGDIVGCASIVQRLWNGKPAWQLRGMAIAERHRGQGIGRSLLIMTEQIVRTHEYSNRLWCNARTPAVGFYEAMGWIRSGAEFHIHTAGPHYRMQKQISTATTTLLL